MRFIITRDEATWLRNWYAVEVDNPDEEPANQRDQAEDKLFNGEYEWLGFDVGENFENAENPIVSVEEIESDATPFVTRPANPPDAARVAALVEAVKAIMPHLNSDLDAHEPWTAEIDALDAALKPFLPTVKEN